MPYHVYDIYLFLKTVLRVLVKEIFVFIKKDLVLFTY